MPELPDVTIYVQALQRFIVGRQLAGFSLRSPFLLRTIEIDPHELVGSRIESVEPMEKKIIWQFTGQRFLVFHLMIAGRFHWRSRRAAATRKVDLAAFQFEHGTLLLTEASPKKRAALYAVQGRDAVEALRRGGLDVLTASFADFAAALQKQNRTLKRALTDPTILSGIGNAYSDEILHAARLSPLQRTHQLDEPQMQRLYQATRETLQLWVARLADELGDGFPEKVTAFRPGMAVHGRYGQPCPRCGAGVQRIVYAENEMNYCAQCQTGGRLLADRSLSRLLKDDWPRTLHELEES